MIQRSARLSLAISSRCWPSVSISPTAHSAFCSDDLAGRGAAHIISSASGRSEPCIGSVKNAGLRRRSCQPDAPSCLRPFPASPHALPRATSPMPARGRPMTPRHSPSSPRYTIATRLAVRTVRIDSGRTLRRYFEPGLADAMNKDQETAAKHHDVGELDVDPFIDAQDYDIKHFDVAIKDTAPGKATATVTFVNFDEQKTIVLELIAIKNDWRIYDITWPRDAEPKTLRALFRLTRQGY